MQPTTDPTPASAAAPPVVGESLVEFVRSDRQRTAYVLFAVGAILLALGGWLAYKASKEPAQAEKPKTELPFQSEEQDKVANPNRSAYIVGALLAAMGVASFLTVGGWLLVSIPPTDPARQKTEARAVILAVGGLLGAVLILAGAAYFYLWSSSLFDWLDKGERKQARYVIAPLLAVALGGLLMFAAMQPARAEERDNRTLRQLIYGANFGLSVLLLFVALVVFNMIVGPRLPNKLDTTATNFYTLSEGSVELLRKMPEPVKAYAILPAGPREYDDIRRLLQNAQDVSGGKLTFQHISPVSDINEYRTLADKYPTLKAHEVEGTTTGVLLTVGEDEKRHSFIRDDEFTQSPQRNPMAQEGGPRLFVGESRLMRELLFLSESEQKAVVYFTQSAGELNVDTTRGAEVRPSGSAQQLKEYLARNNLDVRPLKFDLKDPKVPDDAAVVIVAGPERPLEEAHVAAIRKYMTEPRPGNKKGRLIVLAGAAYGPPPKSEVLRTGLEGLLAEFNVSVEARAVVGLPTREMPSSEAAIAAFSVASQRARNPVAMALGEKAMFPSRDWRQVGPGQGGPAFRAVPLLYTFDRDRYTWLEDHRIPPRELETVVEQLLNDPKVRATKQFSDEPRPVAAAVSEGEVGRVVVVGNSFFVSDDYVRRAGGQPLSFDLVSGSVDWLRERPQLAISVENKQYVEFRFPATTDETRGLWLPLLLAMTVVAGLGLSVWMVRRRAA